MESIWIKHKGAEHIVEVSPRRSIAAAAEAAHIPMYGSCLGQGVCHLCSRVVRSGMEHLTKLDGTPYKHREGYLPLVRMCQVTAEKGTVNGVISIDADDDGFNETE